MFKYFLLILLLISSIIHPIIIQNSTIYIFNIWIKSYLPSVFLVLVITDIISKSKYIDNLLKNINNKILYKAYYISLISGIISGSNILKNINSNDKKINTFYLIKISTLNASFVLVYSTKYVSNSFILLIILLLNIIFNNLYLKLKNKEKNNIIYNQNIINSNNESFIQTLLKSIEINFINLIKMLGIMIFIKSTIDILMYYTNLINNLNIKNVIYLFISLIDIINGLEIININFNNNIFLYTFIISFMGISIHLQSILLFNRDINYFYYLIYNILKSIFISTIITLIYMIL
jgi:hypothetical protein